MEKVPIQNLMSEPIHQNGAPNQEKQSDGNLCLIDFTLSEGAHTKTVQDLKTNSDQFQGFDFLDGSSAKEKLEKRATQNDGDIKQNGKEVTQNGEDGGKTDRQVPAKPDTLDIAALGQNGVVSSDQQLSIENADDTLPSVTSTSEKDSSLNTAFIAEESISESEQKVAETCASEGDTSDRQATNDPNTNTPQVTSDGDTRAPQDNSDPNASALQVTSDGNTSAPQAASEPPPSTQKHFTKSAIPSPTKSGVKKPPVPSPTKVPKPVPAANWQRGQGADGNQTARPKSAAAKPQGRTPTTPTAQKPTAIPSSQQRTVSVDRSRGAKNSITSPRTPSNTPSEKEYFGALDLTKLKTPTDDCAGSTASTPRSSVSVSLKGSESSRSQSRSKIGSLENTKHVPGGGNVTIMSQKVDYSKVNSKCGSKDNMKHTPKGGEKKIESRKLEWKVESKIGSLENTKHKPRGGDKKIGTAKLEWKATSKIGSFENAHHTPGGGVKKIEIVKFDFKEKAQPKIGSKDNLGHKPGGGSKKIETQKLNFKETARPKVDASMNIEKIDENEEEVAKN